MGFGNKEFEKPKFNKISDVVWDIPKNFKEGMRVPVRIIATKKLLDEMDLQVYDQAANVATLPGILKNSFVMSDGHSGYGFPIGGVAAIDAETGIISPGGIGFDVNCGMRLVLTNMTYDDIKPKLKELIDRLFKKVPAGVGGHGFVKVTKDEFKKVLLEGGKWAVDNGYGWKEDLERTELGGVADWADVSKVSQRAIDRGFNQIGTLGSGNHYLEIQVVKEGNIYDKKLAKKWGLFPNQIVVMFHTGSRGEGHQIATDYLQKFLQVMESKYNIKIIDRELACAPFNSPEGQDYWKAMACAVNFSFANRQTILHRIREVFSEVFNADAEKLGLRQVFDIAHNRATLEKHKVDGETKELLVHRKGATAAYPPGRKEIPKLYRDDGSPVIIGGSMETGSYLLAGTEGSNETFCSTAHGSGRTMSRTRAKHLFRGDKLLKDMEQRGIYVRSVSFAGVAEEAGPAYKDIDEVIDATDKAGISKRVVKLLPLGNVKG